MRAVCVRACERRPGRIDLSAWLVGSWSVEPFPCPPEGDGGGGGGRNDVESGALGQRWEETTNLLSALLIMLVRVKLASGSKKGAQGGEGGRGRLFVGIDLCGGRGWGPPPRPSAWVRMGRGGGAGPGEGTPGETRGQSSPAAGRAPLSRSVKLNKEGICVFLTSAGYLIDHKLMYNSLWVFKNVLYNVRSTRVFMLNYFKNNFLSSFSF